MKLADRIGIEALTIRKLAEDLGAGTMSIYYYFNSKEAILDAMVDEVFGEITLPPTDREWKEAVRIRCQSVREVLGRHRWATPLMESRKNPGPKTLKHHDAFIGCLIHAGLKIELAATAVAVIDAFVYGFAIREAALPGGGGEEMITMGKEMVKDTFLEYPHLMKLTMYTFRKEYNFGKTFGYGLDLLLDSLEKES